MIVGAEQLSVVSCLYTLPLLLPLFDLSLPHNASWLGKTLLTSLTGGSVCQQCADYRPLGSYQDSLIDCVVSLDEAQCSDPTLQIFQKLALYFIDTERRVLVGERRGDVFTVLNKVNLSFPTILTKPTTNWDPSCYILCCAFPDRVPLVYSISWLFHTTLPWVAMLVDDMGNFIEGEDVKVVLATLTYFLNHNFKIDVSDVDQLHAVLDSLITIAVNNTTAVHRQDASKCLRFVVSKSTLQIRMKLIKFYTQHENSSVAGLFIDMLKSVVVTHGRELSSLYLKKAITPILKDKDMDIIEESDRVLATLSLIQYLCTSPVVVAQAVDLNPNFTPYIRNIDNLTLLKHKQINYEMEQVKESTPSDRMPATISVQDETLEEPSVSEQMESYGIAICRLDLMQFNIARTKQVLDDFEKHL